MSLRLKNTLVGARVRRRGVLADIYVATSGNDSTGTGSLTSPYATISKALSVATAGKVIAVGAGAYAENTSASGRFQVTTNFASPVTIIGATGSAADVVITGASDATINTIIQSGANNITFQNVTFGMRVNTNLYAIRLAQCSNIIFNNCIFAVKTNNGQINDGVRLQPSGAVAIGAAFNNCVFNCASGTDVARGAEVSWTAGNTITVSFYNCAGNMPENCIYGNGGTFTVTNCAWVSTATHCLRFGADSNTGGNATTATVTGCSITCGSPGHALLFGNGCSGCSASNNQINGGDYGLVLKEHTGSTVSNNTIAAGTAAAVYFKASNGGSVQNNTINVAKSGAIGCKLGAGDTADKNQNVVFAHNTVNLQTFSNTTVFAWGDSTADLGGGTCDANVYNISAAGGTLGTVRSTSGITNLAGLQGAWSGYTPSGNDTHSTVN